MNFDDPNNLLDLIEDLGLNERQQIRTLLNAVEESLDQEDDEDDDEDDE